MYIASTHGTAYGMIRHARAFGEPDGATNLRTAAIGISSTEAIMLIRILVIGYINAVSRFSAYVGWEDPAWTANATTSSPTRPACRTERVGPPIVR